MSINQGFAKALKAVRQQRGLTQEDFGLVSSRTYISTLERGMKSPTIEKIDMIAEVLEVHPVTLIALAYALENDAADAMLDKILDEVEEVLGTR